jgi:hypothetical protein
MVLEGHECDLESIREARKEIVGADSSAGIERIGGTTGHEHQPWGHGIRHR